VATTCQQLLSDENGHGSKLPGFGLPQATRRSDHQVREHRAPEARDMTNPLDPPLIERYHFPARQPGTKSAAETEVPGCLNYHEPNVTGGFDVVVGTSRRGSLEAG
jgi:hypothetical protein